MFVHTKEVTNASVSVREPGIDKCTYEKANILTAPAKDVLIPLNWGHT
jgi:hypothetical protein